VGFKRREALPLPLPFPILFLKDYSNFLPPAFGYKRRRAANNGLSRAGRRPAYRRRLEPVKNNFLFSCQG
jgi:hypothetical protein